MKPWILLVGLTAAAAWPAQRIPPEARGAAEALRTRFPGAVIENVRSPGSGDPGGTLGGERLYWIVRFRTGGHIAEASLTARGLLVRIVAPVESKDVPAAVVKTLKETWPAEALVGISRRETWGTLRFIAAETPRLIYGLTLMKDGRLTKLDIRSDGTVQTSPSANSSALAEAANDPFFPPPQVKEKEIPIPAEAVRAVEAVKREYPGAIVQTIEPTVFNDQSGTVETVYFDVEIGQQGKLKTVPVTPDGILLYTVTPVSQGDLPPVIAQAASKACPGGTFREAVLQEVKAVPGFVPIDQPRTVYTMEVLDGGRRDIAIIAPDGTRIVPARPWHWRGR